jgi:hypothetical protein
MSAIAAQPFSGAGVHRYRGPLSDVAAALS